MSFARFAFVFTAAITVVGSARSVHAQSMGAPTSEPPNNAPVQVGPLTLAPTVRLRNFGHDSDANNRSLDNNPQSDFTATLSPEVDAWLQLAHARVRGRSEFDFYYFKDLQNLRALDTDSAARVDVPLNRLTPFFEGNLTNTRYRWNLEIDTIARRRDDGVKGGVALRLTPKISAEASVRRSRFEYEPNSLYLGTDLAHQLNFTSTAEDVGVRYALTPLTTFRLNMERQRAHFDFAVDRDAESVYVTPSVEFKPHALISGEVSIGFVKRRFLTPGVPDFNGTNAYVDLNYILRGQTRISVRARRELEYSYLIVLRDYLLTDVTTIVTQRFGESWDVGGDLGRARLSYRQASAPMAPGNVPDETGLTYGADVGYTVNHLRVGFHLERVVRDPDSPVLHRGYRRLQVGPTVTYVF